MNVNRRRLSGKCQCVWSHVQQVVGNLGGPVGSAFIIHSSVCGSTDQAFLAQLISISMFMGGLCTVLQTTVGVRYHPCVQVHIHTTVLRIWQQYTACPRKNGPRYNGVVFEILGKHQWNFTTEFSIYVYIMCKNSRKFNVKIVFYYTFLITRPKHKIPWQHGLMHVHSYLQWSSVIIHQLS